MSWFRSAVIRVMEAGGKNNLTRTVRNYAENVTNAVSEGAKILQDRIASRSFKSFRHTAKRLEEVAVSCRGLERILLLRRWLVALKETEQLSEDSVDTREKDIEQTHVQDEFSLSPREASLDLFYDSDLGGEPMNFHNVFLRSQALEGITLSMILDAPNEEEVSLLLEIFGLCLAGGREVHNTVVRSIQDLSKAFLNYQDEVLMKREELLQFAQSAITGLKLNADLVRIDAEASALQKRLEGMKESREASDKGEARTLEALKETLAEVRLCSMLEALLLQKTNLYYGDSPEIHSEKVDKLKVLAESLANSTVKAEKRISDHRNQKEEALNFRLAKTNDVSEAEKELATEIAELDKKRDELEAELKKVNSSLTAARARLHNTKEEREQFDEASNQFLLHLKAKEDDLSRSVASGKVEADVVHIWINFLEDSWHSQSSYIEQKEKQTNHELKKYGNYFADLVTNHLSAYKEELGTFLSCIRKSVDHLKKFNESRAEMESSPDSDLSNQRKKLEEEYVEFEVKIITTFSVADNMKQLFYSQHGSNSRQDDPKVKELFDAIEQIKKEFECIERPTLEIETSSPKGEWPPEEKSHKGSNAIETIEIAQPDKEVSPKSASAVEDKYLDCEAEMATLESESGNTSKDYMPGDIGDWEFDALEQELKPCHSTSNK
ncbi:hypothetical protein MRB53_018997 [Persea americana]|uniref:Uncharacterized protein n=1 Tax=Persea americana TaxID=3435 RepID=A0ACC2MA66_PERAE|nr:hypothetical protein MRB53_018997 [Persea americana]